MASIDTFPSSSESKLSAEEVALGFGGAEVDEILRFLYNDHGIRGGQVGQLAEKLTDDELGGMFPARTTELLIIMRGIEGRRAAYTVHDRYLRSHS